MKKLVKKNLFNPEVHQDCLNRIEKITPETHRQWGKMDPAQMFSHCAEIIEVNSGKELKYKPFVVKLFGKIAKKMILNDKPYKKNLQTHPQYLRTNACDFEIEKKRLLDALNKFVSMSKDEADAITHPLFGKMNAEEKGWANYKHLDHHLSQFGV